MTGLVRRLADRIPVVAFDVVLALAFVVAAQIEVANDPGGLRNGGVPWANHMTAFLMTAPLALRTRRPTVGLLVMALGCAVPTAFVAHTIYIWTELPPLGLMVYAVARRTDGPLARWGWLVVVAALTVASLRLPALRTITFPIFPVVALLPCTLAGRAVRRGRDQNVRLADALQRLAAEQRAREEAAVLTERGRIAAEVQDVVAHAVGQMLLAVGAARLQLQGAHAAVPVQLQAAEKTGRRALAELRRNVAMPGDATASAAPLEPMPDLGGVAELVRGFRATGLDVTCAAGNHAYGESYGDLPQDLQLAAYRILQESLTNVLKHAGRVPVDVALRRECADGADQLVVEVSNAVGPTPHDRLPSGGHGLVGMRERVAMFDGTLSAGESDGRFDVTARLAVPQRSVAAPVHAEVRS